MTKVHYNMYQTDFDVRVMEVTLGGHEWLCVELFPKRNAEIFEMVEKFLSGSYHCHHLDDISSEDISSIREICSRLGVSTHLLVDFD